MPRKKKSGASALLKLERPYKPIHLSPPEELDQVVVDFLSLIPKIGEKENKIIPKNILIKIIDHTASAYLHDLRKNASSNVIAELRNSKVQHSSGNHSPVFKKEKISLLKSSLFPNLFIKTHSRRLGTRGGSQLLSIVNELVLVNIGWALFKFFKFVFGFIKISRSITGARGLCIGEACLWFPRTTQILKLARIGSTPQRIKYQPRETTKFRALHFKSAFELLGGWHRALLGFVCFSLVFVLPLKAFSYYSTLNSTKTSILEKSKKGFLQIANAASLAKYSPEVATSEFERATLSFGDASRELEKINGFVENLAKLHPKTAKELKAGKFLVSAATSLAHSAAVLSGAVSVLSGSENLLYKLSKLRNNLQAVLPDIIAVNNELNKIDAADLNIPESRLLEISRSLDLVSSILSDFVNSGDLISNLLGADSPKRYLFLFQNNTELRPTGGFIGSIAEILVDRGEIKNTFVPGGGSYDLKGGLRVRYAPPEPLRLIAPTWQFQDANWFPDFQASAKKAAWFYERSGGPTVDGVIAINASVVEKLLSFTGPIDMPEYDKVITASNFLLETQKAVELEYDKELNQPKKFIGDLMPRFIETLADGFNSNYFEIVDILASALHGKDLQIFLREESAQGKISFFNWGGEIKNTDQGTDYLLVVNSNIAGQKSDAKMEQKIFHQSEILSDGKIINTVTIKRKHNGVKGELFSGVRNVDYLRVYVPLGSKIIETSGFEEPPLELFKDSAGAPDDPDYLKNGGDRIRDVKAGLIISKEFGKTVFGNWIQTDPGKESIVVLKYELPWLLDDLKNEVRGFFGLTKRDIIKYNILIQKQSGITSEITNQVKINPPSSLIASYPRSWQKSDNILEIVAMLDGDKFYSLLFE